MRLSFNHQFDSWFTLLSFVNNLAKEDIWLFGTVEKPEEHQTFDLSQTKN